MLRNVSCDDSLLKHTSPISLNLVDREFKPPPHARADVVSPYSHITPFGYQVKLADASETSEVVF